MDTSQLSPQCAAIKCADIDMTLLMNRQDSMEIFGVWLALLYQGY